ncbi:hypothetical protein L1887_51342 [Cichorium endivia]|nr:hypothetical protein L1887_51342 [Cichorium endivia]
MLAPDTALPPRSDPVVNRPHPGVTVASLAVARGRVVWLESHRPIRIVLFPIRHRLVVSPSTLFTNVPSMAAASPNGTGRSPSSCNLDSPCQQCSYWLGAPPPSSIAVTASGDSARALGLRA